MALAELMVFLEAPGIVPAILQKMKSLPRTGDAPKEAYLSEEVLERSEQYGPSIRKMLAAQPPLEALHYTRILSRAASGWTSDLRRHYYRMFFDWFAAEGGMSFKAYLEQMRTASLTGLKETEIREYEKLSGIFQPAHNTADLPQPIGPGQAYTAEILNPYIWGDALEQADISFPAGERAYKSALCIVCHRMNGEGGLSGPDLSQIGSKFSRYDLVYAILSPNDQISDQYANTLLELQNGALLTGRVREENDSLLVLMPNPYDPGQEIRVDKATIARRRLSPVSPMPSGLLNRLSEEELKELLIFLLANGSSDHPLYTGVPPSQ
jgi:putative heme-binding domain-containing protein